MQSSLSRVREHNIPDSIVGAEVAINVIVDRPAMIATHIACSKNASFECSRTMCFTQLSVHGAPFPATQADQLAIFMKRTQVTMPHVKVAHEETHTIVP